MSVNGSNNFLNIEDANLRVRNGSVHAQGMTIGGAIVSASHGLQSVSDTGNTTSNTLQFTNATTAFKATSNIELTSASKIIVDSNVVTEYTGPHDRPLREYPEVKFPLSTSSESPANGATTFTYKSYTVTGNSVYNDATSKISNAFDGEEHVTSWTGLLGDYDSNGDVASGKTANYLQIQLPNAIKLEKMKIISDGNYQYANAPRNITLYGSNNGSNWVTLKTETDLQLDGGTTNPDPQTVFVHVNATTKYMYYKLEISKIWISSGGATYARIGEWDLYGHEEGSASLDTTLKSVYNVPATTGTQLEVYYDAKDLTTMPSTVTDLAGGDQNGTVTGHSPTLDNNSFVFDGTGDYIESTLTNDSGAWIFSKSLWFKQTVEPTNLSCMSSIGDYSVSDATFFYLHRNHILISIYSSGAYFPREWVVNEWTHAVAVMKGTTSSINDIELYINGKKVEATSQFGTATTRTLPANAQLRVGREVGSGTSYFNGSIANFRLYSKALNAGQVKELYDYQKDYFLGSKSQVTLYKGHLGVGVTEPSGQLELAGDERIQEYPPRDLGGFETMIEGEGTYKVSSSSDVPNPSVGSSDHPATAFTANDTFFRGVNSAYAFNTAVPATYTGTHFTNGVGGDFIQIELPHKIYLKSINITSRTNGSNHFDRAPHTGFIFGSNNGGTTWSQVAAWTGLNWTLGESKPIQINSSVLYSTYRLVANELANTSGGSSRFNIDRWQLFGTPGPTTLDKGSLTLGRSLDVPRVSRYDVDTATPRPCW